MLPAGVQRPPVVVLIAGSGPTDRDGNNPAGLKPNTLRQLAESLAANGIASYRFDKRGIGKSLTPGMKEDDLRFDMLVGDVAAIIRALQADPRVGPVVVAGHSEGAAIGLLAVKQVPAAGYVSIAGIARNPGDVLHDQLAQQLPPPMLAQSDSIIAELRAGRTVANVPAMLGPLYRASVQPYLISWFRHTPEEEIRTLTGPCLIVQGTHDIQVLPAEADRLKAAQPRCETLVIDGMNHVLKDAPADRVAQMATYTDPSFPLAPGLAARLVAFVRALRAA
jgi:pimeloyl-ACP methyl ester carboxylesterase